MAKGSFVVKLSPPGVLDYIEGKMVEPELVHEERHDLGNGRSMGLLVFERYFWRVGNRVALVL